jgi:hypothetical protein
MSTLERIQVIWLMADIGRAQLFASALICSSIWSIICRVRYLKIGRTLASVALQYIALAMGLLGGLILADGWTARASMAAGIFVFLVLGAPRWRHSAPEGVTKPAPLDEAPLEEVNPRYYPGAKR